MQRFDLTGQLARTSTVRTIPARSIENPYFLAVQPLRKKHENTRQISIDKRLRHEIRTELAG